MRNCDACLGSNERARDGAINIPKDDYPSRRLLTEQSLESHHDSGGLLRVRPGADFQIHVRLGNAKFVKEAPGHRVVVMLAGMHDREQLLLPGREGFVQWS